MFKSICSAQTRHWSENEGLSSRWTEHGIQDSQGFIWVATKNGLNRFDGYKFEVFNTSNLAQLLSNKLTVLCEDHHQNLWIGTESGISVLNLVSYEIEATYTPSDKTELTGANFIRWIERGKGDKMYVATDLGELYVWKSGVFELIPNPFESDGRFGSRLCMDSKDNFIYIYSESRAGHKMDLNQDKIVAKMGSHEIQHVGRVVITDRFGPVLCAKGNLEQVDVQSDTVEELLPGLGEEIFTVIEDYKGNLWSIKNDTLRVAKFVSDNDVEISEKVIFSPQENVRVTHAFEDATGNIWFCANTGIYKLANDQPRFANILRKDQCRYKKYIASFRGIMEDSNGVMFYGGYGGLFRQNNTGEIVRLFDQDPPYTPYILKDRNEKELYAICEGFGIIAVNKQSGEVTQLGKNYSTYSNYKGLYLVAGDIGSDGDFWLGSYDGLLKYSPKRDEYYEVPLEFAGHKCSSYKAHDIKTISNGDVWVGTSFGVFVINKNNKPIAWYGNSKEAKCQLPFNDVSCVFEDSEGKVWLGSATKGVVVLEGDSISKSLTVFDKLADNNVASIQEDLNHTIWIATNNGLSQVDDQSWKIKNYFREEGLSDNEFNRGSYCRTRNGTLYFGGVNGINVINPTKEIMDQTSQAQLVFSKLEFPANDEDEYMQTRFSWDMDKKPIELDPHQGYLYAEFFVSDYLRSEKNTYQYWLEGFGNTQNWTSLASQNHVRFAGLAPGSYTLHVKGADAKGRMVKNELAIPFVVNQVFYKKWWFITLLILIVSLGVAYIVHVRIQKIKEISKMRVRLASDLHDEVGGVLSRITMQAEILAEESSPERKNILQSIAANGRKAMSSMRDMVWSIDARKGDFESLFDKIVEYGQSMMEDVIEDYTFQIDPGLSRVRINPVFKQEIYYIYKEAINNLLKHSDKKKVIVEAKRTGTKFELSVFSSGDNKIKGPVTGSGLMNMEMRATRIKGQVKFETVDGFKVILTSGIR